MTEEEIRNKYQRGNSRVWTGLFLLVIGGVLLAQQMGTPLPSWFFNWETLLIGLGLFLGIRRRFCGIGWLILILIGGYSLIEHYYPAIPLHRYFWPIALICVGLVFILRPRHRYRFNRFEHLEYWKQKKTAWEEQYKNERPSGEDYIDITNGFGGTKKNIYSKDFKGGEVVTFLGGTEINLSQADINGRVILDVTQILGGTKLIIPPHWDLKTTELVSIFGGIEDKRPVTGTVVDPNKVLVLKGTSIFGGIDIRSFG